MQEKRIAQIFERVAGHAERGRLDVGRKARETG